MDGEEINQEKLKLLNDASDQMIVDAINLKQEISDRNKIFELQKIKGFTFHSKNLVNETPFIELQHFIEQTSARFLNSIGYDLKDYSVFITEMWVQKFSQKWLWLA